jgi:hypothetical protein
MLRLEKIGRRAAIMMALAITVALLIWLLE